MYKQLKWEKKGKVCKGRANLLCRSLCLLSRGFEVINHSGQIYSKNNWAKEETEKESGVGVVGEGESKGGKTKEMGKLGYGLNMWRTWHQSPVCTGEMQIEARDRWG